MGRGEIICFGKDITEEELLERERNLLLNLITDITNVSDFESALKITLLKICKDMKWDYGEVWLLDRKEKNLRLHTAHYEREDLKEFYRESKSYKFGFNEEIPGICWSTLKPFWVKDISRAEVFLRKELSQRFHLNSAVGIPMVSEEEFIGTLTFFTSQMGEEDERKIKILSTISKELGFYFQRKMEFEKSRELLELLNLSVDAIMVCDIDDTILFWKKGAEKIYGWEKDEVLGRKITDFVYKDRSKYEEVKKELLEKGEWRGEVRKVRRDGKEIIVESSKSLVKDKEGRPYRIFIRDTDITGIKALQSQVYRAQRLESIGNLASGISHDLNNILSPIIMGCGILKTKIKDKEILDTLAMMEKSAQRGINLVKQILSFARGGEGEKTLIQVKHVIKEVEGLLKETFPKDIKIEVDIQKDLWTILGNSTEIYQVLMNLCVNAKDAMPSGGTLKISAENIIIDEDYARWNIGARIGPYVVITVSDTGVGIPQEIIDKIFDPFFTTKEKGTGLGLSVVYSIVKAHDGFINVYSKEGEGTNFKIYFPAVEVKEEELIVEEEIIKGQEEIILVVDDEKYIREMIKNILEVNGYKVIQAEDGETALRLYKENPNISLILLDYVMPILNGEETLRKLLEINPEVKVVLMSGFLEEAKGFSGYRSLLRKPFTVKELLKTVREAL